MKIRKYIITILLLASNSLLAQSVNITYSYDNINRLTSVSYTTGQSVSYTYDKAGNILKSTTTGSTVDGNNNTITGYVYASNGGQGVLSTAAITPITSAMIALYNNDTLSLIERVITDSSGHYIFANIPNGLYFIQITKDSIEDIVINSISVESGMTVNYDSVASWIVLDFDGDGIIDSEDLDDDNDGMPDSYEIDYGFDRLDASDANEDFDGDGVTNLNEYKAGTSPLDPNDTPVINITPVIIFLLG